MESTTTPSTPGQPPQAAPLWDELRGPVCRAAVLRAAEALRRDPCDIPALIDAALREAGVLPAAWLMLAAVVAGQAPPAPTALRVLLQLPEDFDQLAAVLAWNAQGRRGLLLDLCESEALMWGQTEQYLFLATEDLQGAPPPPRLLAALRRWSREMDPPSRLLSLAIDAVADPYVRQVGRAHLEEAKSDKAVRAQLRLRRLLKAPPLDVAPERPEHRASGFTVRRAARVGRNDPCPCGSGSKYKRCCEQKEQLRAADLAPVPGLTLREYRARMAEFVPLAVIEEMTPDELLPYPLETMPPEYLKAVARRLITFHRWEQAERAVELLEAMPAEAQEAAQLRREILYVAFAARAEAVMRRQQQALGGAEGVDEFATLALEMVADRSPALRRLEELVVAGLQSCREELLLQLPSLVQVCYPGLGLLLGRAALNILFPRETERELKRFEAVRDRLCLPPGDRFARMIYVYAQAEGGLARQQVEELEWQRDRDGTLATLAAREEELKEARRQIEELGRALAAAREARDQALSDLAAAQARVREERAAEREQEDERRRLLGKIERLKAVVAEGVAERAALRDKLQEAEERLRAAETGTPAPAAGPGAGAAPEEPSEDGRWESDGYDGWRVVLTPLWGKAAQAALHELPPHIAREALVTVGQLAAGEPAAWRDAKRLKAVVPPLYEARVGLRYRAIFRIVDSAMEVLEIIHRRQLDLRLKHLYA